MRLVPIRTLQDGRENYAEVFVAFLRRPRNGQTTNYAEMCRTVPVIEKLSAQQASADQQAFVMLEDGEWRELVDRLVDEGADFLQNSSEALEMVRAVIQAQEVN